MAATGPTGFVYDNRGTPQDQRGRDRSRGRSASIARPHFDQPVLPGARYTMSTPPRASGRTEAEKEADRAGFESVGARMTMLEQRVLAAEGVAGNSAAADARQFENLIQQATISHQEWNQKFTTNEQQVAGKINQIETQIMRLSAELQQARNAPSGGQGSGNGGLQELPSHEANDTKQVYGEKKNTGESGNKKCGATSMHLAWS